MIKKENFYSFVFIITLVLSVISYEAKIYNDYYSYFQFAIVGMNFILLLFITKYDPDISKQIKILISKQKYILSIMFGMIISTIIGYLCYRYNSLSSIVSVTLIVLSIIVEFYLLPLICRKYNKMENRVINCIVFIVFICSLISIAIKLNGKFLGYKPLYGVRICSIFYDPNFAAMILGIGFLLTIKKNKINKLLKFCILIIILVAILLTGSRGTLISIIVSFVLYLLLYSNLKKGKKIFFIVSFLIICLYGTNLLNEMNFFRVYQGSNKRLEMWSIAIKYIVNKPLFGYGYQSVNNFLHSVGYTNASTHNSFIDYAFCYGLINFFAYVLMIIKILFINIKNRDEKMKKYILVTIFSLINANTILYSFGGVGISSYLFTLFLGLINLNRKELQYEHIN